jgi:hypothetical protein
VAVLQEDPPPLEHLSLGDELLCLGPLPPAQGDHVQVQGGATVLLGESQQGGTRIRTYTHMNQTAVIGHDFALMSLKE